MKKRQFEKHLRRQGCSLLRQGKRHEWWGNDLTGAFSAVPRHSEVQDQLAEKICRDLCVAGFKRR